MIRTRAVLGVALLEAFTTIGMVIAARGGARASRAAEAANAGENERMRVAAELHDGSIQHLASLGHLLDRACRRLRAGDVDAGLRLVERARSELTVDLAALRRVMSGLRPPVLDDGGLEAAIRDCAAGLGREHGVRCEVEADLDGAALSPEIETVIYRVTQESLANVAKHAGAGRALVRLVARGDRLELWIDDDGSGFDPTTLPQLVREGHFGVIGMHERVEGVGGSLHLQSALGAGTSVHVTLQAAPRPDALQPSDAAVAA